MDHLEVRKYELEIKKKTSYDIGFYDGRGELVGGAGGGGLDSGMYTVLISENGNKWSVTIIGNYGAVAKTRGLTPLYNKHIYFRGPADKIILNKWIGKFSLNNNNITSDSIKDGECGLVIMSSDKL
jgi:hypothetical protein